MHSLHKKSYSVSKLDMLPWHYRTIVFDGPLHVLCILTKRPSKTFHCSQESAIKSNVPYELCRKGHMLNSGDAAG